MKAMDIAHILDSVLSNVEKCHDLAQCVRVNRSWHSLGIRYLWQGQTLLEPETIMTGHVPTKFLLDLSKDIARFKHYSQHIKHLNLFCLEDYNVPTEQFEHYKKQLEQLMRPELWDSCRLTTFRLQFGYGLVSRDYDSTLALPMLRPQLRKLHLDGVRITASFLESLRAVSLRWLTIRFPNDGISDQTLQSLLISQQDLLGLSLSFTDQSSSKYATSFATIANLTKLRHFHTNLEQEIVFPLDADNHHFASLESLRVPPSYFNRLIAKNIKKLTSLRALTLLGPGLDEYNPDGHRTSLNTTLDTLSRLSTLEEIEIWNQWLEEEEELNEFFVDLARSNPDLRKFEINYDDPEDYPHQELTAASILTMARSCPKLENFVWPWVVSTDFSPFLEALMNIASQLRSLNIQMDLPVRSIPSLPFNEGSMYFQELFVDTIVIEDLEDDDVLKLLETLAERLPHLRRLGFHGMRLHGGGRNPMPVVRSWQDKIKDRPVIEPRPSIDLEIQREALET